MSKGRIIFADELFSLRIERLCYRLIERYDDFTDTCLVGIQPRGTLLANRLHERLCDLLGKEKIEYGRLDITFYRDDFRTRVKPLKASVTEMNFIVENKNVLLVDDVLYTGRTVQAALTALNHYGRPHRIELITLIDRRFDRELPIKADYIGERVDALDKAYIKVDWKETNGRDCVTLFQSKEHVI